MNLRSKLSAWLFSHADKVFHYAVANIGTVILLAAGTVAFKDARVAAACAYSLVAVAALLWEINDHNTPGNYFSVGDFLAGLLGALTGVAPVLLLGVPR